MLCDIARVSLSGYYAWMKRKKEKRTQEDREGDDLQKIESLVLKHKRKHGYRTVSMDLKRIGSPMNHKKVLRLMKKYHLLAKVRRKNPYKQMQKATQEHSIASNLVNREFQWSKEKIMMPYSLLWTDITYLRLGSRWTYLSFLKDMITGEALSWKLSQHLWLESVQDTLMQLEMKSRSDEVLQKHLQWAYIHSDQWFHYTHPTFSIGIKKMGCIQSMSRRWNCIDNAPTESFFGHMKDELDIKSCSTFSELEKAVDEYMHHYNHDRPQWNKKKMTPVEYRNHLLEISK